MHLWKVGSWQTGLTWSVSAPGCFSPFFTCKHNILVNTAIPSCSFSPVEMRLEKCINVQHKYQPNTPQDSMFLFPSLAPCGWNCSKNYSSVKCIIPLCLRKPKISPTKKNNFDLLCTVNFAIVIHPGQDEKQLVFTALLLVWLEKWLEKTVWANHSNSQGSQPGQHWPVSERLWGPT